MVRRGYNAIKERLWANACYCGYIDYHPCGSRTVKVLRGGLSRLPVGVDMGLGGGLSVYPAF